jgi:hypothetical protein
MRKTLATLNLLAGTTLTFLAVYEVLKVKIKSIAELETVQTEAQYVLVKAARGDYNKPGGIEMMKYDYKFFQIISNFHK